MFWVKKRSDGVVFEVEVLEALGTYNRLTVLSSVVENS